MIEACINALIHTPPLRVLLTWSSYRCPWFGCDKFIVYNGRFTCHSMFLNNWSDIFHILICLNNYRKGSISKQTEWKPRNTGNVRHTQWVCPKIFTYTCDALIFTYCHHVRNTIFFSSEANEPRRHQSLVVSMFHRNGTYLQLFIVRRSKASFVWILLHLFEILASSGTKSHYLTVSSVHHEKTLILHFNASSALVYWPRFASLETLKE